MSGPHMEVRRLGLAERSSCRLQNLKLTLKNKLDLSILNSDKWYFTFLPFLERCQHLHQEVVH